MLRLRGEQLLQEVEPLRQMLAQELRQPIECRPALGGNFYLTGESVHLYLRLWPHQERLVCAQIEVWPKGKGLGTRVMRCLIEFARQKGLAAVVLESTVTPESVALAKKLGMVEDPLRPDFWVLDLRKPT